MFNVPNQTASPKQLQIDLMVELRLRSEFTGCNATQLLSFSESGGVTPTSTSSDTHLTNNPANVWQTKVDFRLNYSDKPNSVYLRNEMETRLRTLKFRVCDDVPKLTQVDRVLKVPDNQTTQIVLQEFVSIGSQVPQKN